MVGKIEYQLWYIVLNQIVLLGYFELLFLLMVGDKYCVEVFVFLIVWFGQEVVYCLIVVQYLVDIVCCCEQCVYQWIGGKGLMIDIDWFGQGGDQFIVIIECVLNWKSQKFFEIGCQFE